MTHFFIYDYNLLILHLTIKKGSELRTLIHYLLATILLQLVCEQAGASICIPRDTFNVLDSHSGLVESRIRNLAVMPDGRIGILTAGNIIVSDGNGFISRDVTTLPYVKLDDYDSYRHMFTDIEGRIWIKSGEELSAILSENMQSADIGNIFRSMGIKGKISNFFADKDGNYIFITDKHDLMYHGRESGIQIVDNIADTPFERLERVECSEGKAYLCYNNGLLLIVDIKTSKRDYRGLIPDILPSSELRKGISTLITDSLLVISINELKCRKGIIAAFDIGRRMWLTPIGIDGHVTSLALLNDGRILAGGNSLTVVTPGFQSAHHVPQLTVVNHGKTDSCEYEVSAIASDPYGGLWLGTLENGLLYLNKKRQSRIKTSAADYGFKKTPKYVSSHASRQAEKLAPRRTNCSFEDRRGRVWLGTVDGIIVTDSAGKRSGLLNPTSINTANVQAIAADKHGDIWFTTPRNIGKVRFISPDSVELSVFGELDGILLSGKEFRTGELRCDSIGMMHAGFAGGTCIFHPDSLHYPRYVSVMPSYARIESTSTPGWILVVGIISVILCLTLATAYIYHSRKQSDQASSQQNSQNCTDYDENTAYLMNVAVQMPESEQPDKEFLEKLRSTIEQNLSNADLSVQSLSGMMAMDRSVLYRRLQALTGMSPSEYIRNIRMSVASRLLTSDRTLSIAEVAALTGYSDSRYFSKVFKSQFGVSPSVYAQNNGNS